MSTIEERVMRGAALLDKIKPGWDRQIDLDALSIASVHECVLGQVYGDFFTGLIKMSPVEAESSSNLGFNGSPGEYQALTEAWRTLILARRTPPTQRGIIHKIKELVS